MNLKQLREFINSPAVAALPDETPVGACGHYGQFIEANETCFEVKPVFANWEKRGKPFTAVLIDAIDIGDEPI